MAVRGEQLRPGDLLLLRSPGRLSWAVRLFDGAEVDRAALVIGDGRVVELVDGAPALRALDECLGAAEAAVARRLKEPASMEPVVARAESLREAHASGRPQVLLGLLACARKLRAAPSLRSLQRACLEAGAAALSAPRPTTPPPVILPRLPDAPPHPAAVYTPHPTPPP